MTSRRRLGVAAVMAACLASSSYVRSQSPASAPALVVQSGHAEQVDVAAFSDDGRLLATADLRGSIRVWEVGTARQLAALPWRQANVAALRFSPDGTHLASAGGPLGGGPAQVSLWDVARGREVRTLTGPQDDDALKDLDFSADGTLLAAAGDDVHVWNTGSGEHLQTIPMQRYVTVAFHPQRAVLAIRGPAEVKLWSPDAPMAAPIRLGNYIGARQVVFAASGSLLAVPDADRLVVIDVDRWRVARRPRFEGEVRVLPTALAPDSVVVELGSRYELWNVTTGRKTRDVRAPAPIGVPDSQWRLFAELRRPGSAEITLHDMTGVEPPKVLSARTARARAVAFSRDGSRLATTFGPRFWVWDLQSGLPRLSREAPIASNAVASDLDMIAFTPEGRRVFAADRLWNLAEWDTSSGELTNRVALPRKDETMIHACSADGRWCVTADRSRIELRDMDSWLVQRTFTPGAAYDLAITHDGQFVATGGREIDIWETRNGRRRSLATAEFVTSVAFSGDGATLATIDMQGALKLWDVATGRELRSIETGRANPSTMAMDPAGRLVAVGASDNTVGIWDLQSEQRVHILEGHVHVVDGLEFDPKGGLLATGSRDGTVRLWNAQTGRELAMLTATPRGDDWLVVTPDGAFDGSSTAAETLVGWRMGTTVYPAERFFNTFFRPGLLTAALDETRPAADAVPDLAAVTLPPAVRILEGVSPARTEPHLALRVRGEGEIDEISLYQNGARVATQPGAPQAVSEYTFDVELLPGGNELKVVAVGRDRITSNPDTVRVTYDAPLPPKPNLHVLAIGVSRYRGAAWQLGFARADAESLAAFFEGTPRTLFADVSATVLTDEQATRPNIEKALDGITIAARPQDVVLIYFAGHGLASEGRYYLLPHDMQDETSLEADVRKYGISDTALLDRLRRIKALKRVVVLDACESGSALDVLSRSAGAERRALEALARAEGLFIIAASTRQQEAVEIPQLGHGILTYALLSGLGAKGDTSVPGTVTMHGLLQYVGEKVPELAARFGRSTRQVPVTFHRGMDFPLVAR